MMNCELFTQKPDYLFAVDQNLEISPTGTKFTETGAMCKVRPT